MKKYKGIIILLVLLGGYALIMILVFGRNNSNNNSSNNSQDNNVTNSSTDNGNYYITLNNISNWYYYHNKWDKVNTDTFEKSGFYFKAYVNNNYLGDYQLKYGTIWNLFDTNNNYVNYNGNLVAFSTNFNVNLRSFKANDISDNEKSTFLNKYNITNFKYLITNQVINIDLDNNGVNDQIICLSNMDENTNLKNSFYNLVVINFNGTWNTLINVNGNDNDEILKSPIYEVTNIMNINNVPSIIVKYTYGYISESPEIGNIMYQLNNDQFVKVISD
jgi:hypothetical protein